jgi:hypothetical protein
MSSPQGVLLELITNIKIDFFTNLPKARSFIGNLFGLLYKLFTGAIALGFGFVGSGFLCGRKRIPSCVWQVAFFTFGRCAI